MLRGTCHISFHLAGVQEKDGRAGAFAPEFRGHVSRHMVQGSLGCRVRGETIFHVSKFGGRSGIARDEDDGANGKIGCKEALCVNDWPDCVCMQVQGEVII